jgi:hypothetical protein
MQKQRRFRVTIARRWRQMPLSWAALSLSKEIPSIGARL